MKIYQEEQSSNFVNNGIKYDLNKIFKLTSRLPVELLDVQNLDWIFENNKECQSCANKEIHEKRVKFSDLSFPIIVTLYHQKLLVIDGAHRLEKAIQKKDKQIQGVVIKSDDLSNCRIN